MEKTKGRPATLAGQDSEYRKALDDSETDERTAQRWQQLEANILRDGCLEPLSVWKTEGKNILLDGHNRYAICEEHGKKFQIVEIEIEDRDHAKIWIGERQLGRRNLTEDQRTAIADDIYEVRATCPGSPKCLFSIPCRLPPYSS